MCVGNYYLYLLFICELFVVSFLPGSSVARARQSVDVLFVHKVMWQGMEVALTLCLFTFHLDPSANVSGKCLW